MDHICISNVYIHLNVDATLFWQYYNTGQVLAIIFFLHLMPAGGE